jgi:D-hydroxyproline dehydrogenase subunit gamma
MPRPDEITVWINDSALSVAAGTTVACAIVMAGAYCRRSVRGERRGPLCGIGVCFECRAEIDGVPHRRTCQLLCSPGMKIRSDEAGY